MRPQSIEEFIGQEQIVGEGRLLRRAIKADMISSVIFYGPPGTGKTSLARVIANSTQKHFHAVNAVLCGVAEVRGAIGDANRRLEESEQGTILFVDEVHRWNKAQQDALLPWVENGTVVFIGATTHNPFFEVNRALVSRSRIFQLRPLAIDDLQAVMDAALGDAHRGYGKYAIEVTPEAREHLLQVSNGDARTLLNALQLAVESASHAPPARGSARPLVIDTAVAEESIQRKAVLYDRDGDYHFDTISAFIKSVRGSDADAALYWLARMVAAGEDPRYMLRRMIILAAEDIGLADPQALTVAESAASAFERIGMPEGQFILSEATLYLALAPKSNSTIAYYDALRAVEREPDREPPAHTRDASRDREGFGHGAGYLYPHAYQEHWVAQTYLPPSLHGRLFYQPNDQGYEGARKQEFLRHREQQLALEATEDRELLSWSAGDRQHERWLRRLASQSAHAVSTITAQLLARLTHQRSDRILICGRQCASLVWEAVRAVPEGGVQALIFDQREYESLNYHIAQMSPVERPELRHSASLSDLMAEQSPAGRQPAPARSQPAPAGRQPAPARSQPAPAGRQPAPAAHQPAPAGRHFEILFCQFIADHIDRHDDADERWHQWLRDCHALLAPRAHLAIIDRLPRYGSRLSTIATEHGLSPAHTDALRECEQRLYGAEAPPYYRRTEEDIEAFLGAAGYTDITISHHTGSEERTLTPDLIRAWLLNTDRAAHSYARHIRHIADHATAQQIAAALVAHIATGEGISWPFHYTIVHAART